MKPQAIAAGKARIELQSQAFIAQAWTQPMATYQDTLNRQWLMLQCIPRQPQKIDARSLVERLHAEGHAVTKRTVERDLAALAASFPLVVDNRSKPFGWSWTREARSFSLPGMSPLQALVLTLAHANLDALLPAHLSSALSPYFQQARSVLQQATGTNALADWSDKVAVVEPTQPLLAPPIQEAAIAAVHEALLGNRQLKLRYHSRSAGGPMPYRVHPLGVVYRGTIGYLVGTIDDYTDPRQFALHRIAQAEVVDEAVCTIEGFVLGDYAHSGAFGFMDNGPIKLVLRMEVPAAQHLHETPLSEDQLIELDLEPGWVRIAATVRDTSQLRWWLLGFGDQVEVMEPLPFRRFINDIVASAVNLYDKPAIDARS